MRITQFFHQIVLAFVTMDPATATELQGEAAREYKKLVDDLESVETKNAQIIKETKEGEVPILLPLTGKQKLTKIAEHWLTRYGLATLFILIVPMLKKYIRNLENDEEPERQDDFMTQLLEFQKFRQMSGQ